MQVAMELHTAERAYACKIAYLLITQSSGMELTTPGGNLQYHLQKSLTNHMMWTLSIRITLKARRIAVARVCSAHMCHCLSAMCSLKLTTNVAKKIFQPLCDV